MKTARPSKLLMPLERGRAVVSHRLEDLHCQSLRELSAQGEQHSVSEAPLPGAKY